MRRVIVARAPRWDGDQALIVEEPALVGVLRWSHAGPIPGIAVPASPGGWLTVADSSSAPRRFLRLRVLLR